MKKIKKWVAILTFSTMITTNIQDVNAQEYYTDTGGCAYESAYESCCIAPAIALALVAIAAIVAVGVHNKGHSSHGHNSHSSD